MASPRKVRTAAEEANRRATCAATTRHDRTQQDAVQRALQAAARRRRRADSSDRSRQNEAKRLCREDPVVRGAEIGATLEPLHQLTL